MLEQRLTKCSFQFSDGLFPGDRFSGTCPVFHHSFRSGNARVSGEPSRLPNVFIVEAAETSSHHAAAAQVADSFARVSAINNGQPSDVMAKHLSRSLGNN